MISKIMFKDLQASSVNQTEDETLMNVESSCFRCTSFLDFSVLCYFTVTVSFKFPTR